MHIRILKCNAAYRNKVIDTVIWKGLDYLKTSSCGCLKFKRGYINDADRADVVSNRA